MTSFGSGPGTGPVPSREPLGSPAPVEVNDFHRYDDVDVSDDSHHHTLGNESYQAAPGNHGHPDLATLASSGGQVLRSGVYNNVTQVIPASTLYYVTFPLDGYMDSVPTPFSDAYSDRTTYPQRLRLPPTTGIEGLWQTVAQIPMNIGTANSILEMGVAAFESDGTLKSPPCVERFVIQTPETYVFNLVGRPVSMSAGDFFQVYIYTPQIGNQISGGFGVNVNLTAVRLGSL